MLASAFVVANMTLWKILCLLESHKGRGSWPAQKLVSLGQNALKDEQICCNSFDIFFTCACLIFIYILYLLQLRVNYVRVFDARWMCL